jgi:hypothetical protein
MGVHSAVPKGASAKVSRGSRRRVRSVFTRQAARTAVNKLRRINKDRAKSGKPPLTSHKAPDGTMAYLTGPKYHA